MAGLPGGMPGYPGMYHQPQAYPYMAPYSLNAPYLGGMHPGFAAYPQACPWPCLCSCSLQILRPPTSGDVQSTANDSRGVRHMPCVFRRPTCPGIHVQEVMAVAAIGYFQRCAYINGFLPDGRCGGQQGGVGRLPWTTDLGFHVP